MSTKNKNTDALIATIIKGIEEVKGNDIDILDLREIENTVCDYFIICHGNSNTHVASIAEEVQEMVRKNTGEKPFHVEGIQNAEWILIDFVDVVVHVFQKEKRAFYDLENLWADAS